MHSVRSAAARWGACRAGRRAAVQQQTEGAGCCAGAVVALAPLALYGPEAQAEAAITALSALCNYNHAGKLAYLEQLAAAAQGGRMQAREDLLPACCCSVVAERKRELHAMLVTRQGRPRCRQAWASTRRQAEGSRQGPAAEASVRRLPCSRRPLPRLRPWWAAWSAAARRWRACWGSWRHQ